MEALRRFRGQVSSQRRFCISKGQLHLQLSVDRPKPTEHDVFNGNFEPLAVKLPKNLAVWCKIDKFYPLVVW